MSENPPKVAAAEPQPDGLPYPEYGSDDDTHARILLLDWLCEQIGTDGIDPQVGDYVLATEGRILGYGPDREELHDRVYGAEPELRKARVVGYRVPLDQW